MRTLGDRAGRPWRAHGRHRRTALARSSPPPSSGSRRAQGRVIVTGMGKSGHVARKIAATFASTGTPVALRAPGRGEPRRSRHGAAGGRDHRPLLVGRDDGARRPHRLCQALPRAADRDDVERRPRRSGGRRTSASPCRRRKEACPNGLAPDDLDHHAARPRRCARGRAARAARLHGRAFPRLPSGRQARRPAQARARRHAHGRAAADRAHRHADGRGHRRDQRARGSAASIVVDADGLLAGIVTDGDLRRNLRPDLGSCRSTRS